MRSLPTDSAGVPIGGDAPATAPPSQDRQGGSGRRRRQRTLQRLLLEVAVLGAAAVFVVLRAGNSLGSVGSTFSHLRWHWLLVAGGAEVGSIFCLSWLQQRLLREGELQVGVRDLLPVTMASNAVAQSLPAGTLFAEGYSFRQYQKLGAGWTLGVWAELSAGAIEASALATVALVGAVIVGPSLRLELLPVLGFVWVGAAIASTLFGRPGLLGRLIARVLRLAEGFLPEKACGRMRSAERSLGGMVSFRPSAKTWLRCHAVAISNWGFDSVVLVAALLSVGGPVPWRAVLLSYAAAQLLVELPITPGGLGLVEGGLTELLTRFHMGVTQATAGTLMYRAFSYWLLVLVGWVAAGWLAVHNRRAERRRATGEYPGGQGRGGTGRAEPGTHLSDGRDALASGGRAGGNERGSAGPEVVAAGGEAAEGLAPA